MIASPRAKPRSRVRPQRPSERARAAKQLQCEQRLLHLFVQILVGSLLVPLAVGLFQGLLPRTQATLAHPSFVGAPWHWTTNFSSNSTLGTENDPLGPVFPPRSRRSADSAPGADPTTSITAIRWFGSSPSMRNPLTSTLKSNENYIDYSEMKNQLLNSGPTKRYVHKKTEALNHVLQSPRGSRLRSSYRGFSDEGFFTGVRPRPFFNLMDRKNTPKPRSLKPVDIGIVPETTQTLWSSSSMNLSLLHGSIGLLDNMPPRPTRARFPLPSATEPRNRTTRDELHNYTLDRRMQLIQEWDKARMSEMQRVNRTLDDIREELLHRPASVRPTVHEVNETIVRNRRSDNPHKSLQNQPKNAHSPFIGYDCSKPKYVRDMAFTPPSSCERHHTVTSTRNASFQLLQYEHRRTAKGFRCRILDTREVAYCGVYDHQTARPLLSYVDLPISVSEEQCLEMISTTQYVDIAGRKYNLAMNQINYISFFEAGSTWSAGDISKGESQESKCQGARWYAAGHAYDGVVVAHRMKIEIADEDFVARDGSLYAQATSMKLGCEFERSFCRTASYTYTWRVEPNHCPLAVSRPTRGLIARTDDGTDTYMSTDDSLIRLVLLESTYMCDRRVYKTNYKDLYLVSTETQEPFRRQLNPAEASISTYVRNRDDFLYHHIINQVEEELNDFLGNDCKRQERNAKTDYFLRRTHPGIVTFYMENGTFATGSGDVLWVYQCSPVVVTAKEVSRCYDALPVRRAPVEGGDPQANETLFLEPITHRLRRHASVLPCSPLFVQKYKAQNDAWIVANPKIHVGGEPLPYKYDGAATQFRWDRLPGMSGGGAYTPGTLDDKERLLEFADFREEIRNNIPSQMYEESDRDLVPLTSVFPNSPPALEWLSPSLSKWLGILESFGSIVSLLGGLCFIWLLLCQLATCLTNAYFSFKATGFSRQLALACCPSSFLTRSYTRALLIKHGNLAPSDLNKQLETRQQSQTVIHGPDSDTVLAQEDQRSDSPVTTQPRAFQPRDPRFGEPASIIRRAHFTGARDTDEFLRREFESMEMKDFKTIRRPSPNPDAPPTYEEQRPPGRNEVRPLREEDEEVYAEMAPMLGSSRSRVPEPRGLSMASPPLQRANTIRRHQRSGSHTGTAPFDPPSP